MSELKAGALIGGRYRLSSLLSEDEPGARTFHAEHAGEGRALRLTVYEVLHPPQPAQVQRFAEALRAAERLNHPAFPPVRETGYEVGAQVLWSVRDVVPGELPLEIVLRRALDADGLSQPWLLHLQGALADALLGLYRAKQVHGRLWPNRVHFVPAAEGVRVLVEGLGLEDFRRAEGRQLLALQESGHGFLAPELAQPGPLTHATDVYGLGALVRELDSGRAPWMRALIPRGWYNTVMAPEPSRRGNVYSVEDTLRFLFPSGDSNPGLATSRPFFHAPPTAPTESPLFAPAVAGLTAGQELNPEPPEDRSPHGVARFEDFVEAFARALPDFTPQPVSEGVDFPTRFGRVLLRRNTVEVNGLRWALPVSRRLGIVEGFVRAVLETALRCVGPSPGTGLEVLEAALQRLHFGPEPKQGVRRWSHMALIVEAGPEHLTAYYRHEAWVSSHEVGRVETEYLSVPCSRLPADVEQLVAMLWEVIRVAPMMSASPRFVCRFCRRTFDSLAFSPDDKACHSCAETRLGVKY